ncbi:hypothetical protein AB0B04_18865 [Streptomyces xinghaiensis]|uniref:Uncharacterized protein n=2 Tax=Streptomyces TaxID=1883 RepID=A0A3R7FP51_9ACTN|nr:MULTISPECIES: hypothetical protein [Streptomyces]KNE81386.1 hypothetical protein ADZ36_16530 [Streptomyces fradiae]OFA48275.1 hypothetical protein BEN35_19235 [Streptomyces fradiae]PQM20656.1 hypothetical protein Sfr7A_26080 [Streptomyces xinghaiensis]RKM92596.1 hypothetical protein SFRA_024735 [Streptomyces xinghaiensis]RNC70564.1 hypothetical protein DC095_025725 [Streptomyces xinghaiensis]
MTPSTPADSADRATANDETPTPEIQAVELTATLYINPFDSACGECHQPTAMDAYRHTDVSGWGGEPGGGCGARFVNTASHHTAITPAILRRSRPDLPVRDTPTP